jgi:nitrate transport ATP-binding subunits C and D
MKHAFLQVEGLTKIYKGGRGKPDVTVFKDINFEMQAGEFVCVLGHSGCGKTTILNILAGLDEPSAGVAIMAGRELSGPSLDRGVVFQNHALLPWLTALENVAFGVRSRWPNWNRIEIEHHSSRYLDMVGLGHAAHKKPSELSGGMKQRVGIARAFAIQPKMLLLDEPFGALDALTRGTIQDELLSIVRETRQTVFMITHDIDEAILLADRILLMSNGPFARIAESVKIELPRDRTRETMVHHPDYYRLRNHLIDFLWGRAGEKEAQARPLPKSASITPIPTLAAKGDFSHESRRHHGTHSSSQTQAQAQLGSAGRRGWTEQGVDVRRASGTNDLDAKTGRSGGSRSGTA